MGCQPWDLKQTKDPIPIPEAISIWQPPTNGKLVLFKEVWLGIETTLKRGPMHIFIYLYLLLGNYILLFFLLSLMNSSFVVFYGFCVYMCLCVYVFLIPFSFVFSSVILLFKFWFVFWLACLFFMEREKEGMELEG